MLAYNIYWQLIGYVLTNRKKRWNTCVRVVIVTLQGWCIVSSSYHGNCMYFWKNIYTFLTNRVLIIHVKRYRLSHTHLYYYKRSTHIRIPKYLNISKKFVYECAQIICILTLTDPLCADSVLHCPPLAKIVQWVEYLLLLYYMCIVKSF